MKPTGCIRCGAAGSFVMFPLEHVACVQCMSVWLREESCSVEIIEAVVGKFNGVDHPGHMKRFVAELLKRTEAWARAWRAAA